MIGDIGLERDKTFPESRVIRLQGLFARGDLGKPFLARANLRMEGFPSLGELPGIALHLDLCAQGVACKAMGRHRRNVLTIENDRTARRIEQAHENFGRR